MFTVFAKENLSHNPGKTIVRPKKKMIPPEIHFQKSWGILINNELALSRSVKRITDTPSDPTTTKSLFLLGFSPATECPIITGRRGKMHGARTVSIPAINEIKRSNMLFYF